MFRLPYTTKIGWDPVADISYITGIAGYAFGLVVPAESSIKNWANFVGYAKANPGKLNHGSTGALTQPAPDDGGHRATGRPRAHARAVQR